MSKLDVCDLLLATKLKRMGFKYSTSHYYEKGKLKRGEWKNHNKGKTISAPMNSEAHGWLNTKIKDLTNDK